MTENADALPLAVTSTDVADAGTTAGKSEMLGFAGLVPSSTEGSPYGASESRQVAGSVEEANYEFGVVVAKSQVLEGGDGLFASRSYAVGEPMIQEGPMAVLDSDAYNKFDSALLAQAHEQLVANGQQQQLLHSQAGSELFRGPPGNVRLPAFRQWVTHAWPNGTSEYHEHVVDAMMVFAYNAFSSKPGDRLQLIFPKIAKANHSCSANAIVVAPEDGLGELICDRPIEAGEEITVSYLALQDLRKPAKHRQGLLRDGWGFACTCVRCMADVDDMRRFACPHPGCGGHCLAFADNAGQRHLERYDVEVDTPIIDESEFCTPCNLCACRPPPVLANRWCTEEFKVSELVDDLPKGLYSAWAACEEFSTAHPEHHLTGEWKRFITRHIELEISEAETEDEVAELRCEAALHRAAFERVNEAAKTATDAAAAADVQTGMQATCVY